MRWSYKTVHFSLKKEGLLGSAFLDENEIEISLNEYGRLGWELVSFMEINDGLIAIFKQPFAQGFASVQEEEHTVKLAQTAEATEISPTPSPEIPVAVEKEPTLSDEADVGLIRIF